MPDRGGDGHKQRFEAMVRGTQRDVRAYAARRLDTLADVDDVVAEVYATAWRRFHELDEITTAWLFGVARKVLGNHHRGQQRQRHLAERVATIARPYESGDGHPENSSSAPEFEVLCEIWPTLPKAHREILTLACWDDLAIGEIATTLQISRPAVSVRLHRARKHLRARWSQQQARTRPRRQEDGT